MLQRFFNEARAATKAKDPGIVEVFDFGTTNSGISYIIMEVLRGQSLAERLRRGAMAPELAIRVARQTAAGLAAAHGAGIIHRDLKPDNLFLVADQSAPGGERIKILDFGVARLQPLGAAGMTRTGSIMGTPMYMSPEQVRGAHKVDGRADLYALGCILFEMLTGRTIFTYTGLAEIIAAHMMEEPVTPRSLNPRVPEDLSKLTTRLLAKSPDARPKDARALIKELDGLRQTSSQAATVFAGEVPRMSGGMAIPGQPPPQQFRAPSQPHPAQRLSGPRTAARRAQSGGIPKPALIILLACGALAIIIAVVLAVKH
jgi:serine/threonine-protein kinase